MSDDKTPHDAVDRADPPKPEQRDNPAQKSQSDAPASARRSAPGRPPLFRNH
jgi:hypothetical protein